MGHPEYFLNLAAASSDVCGLRAFLVGWPWWCREQWRRRYYGRRGGQPSLARFEPSTVVWLSYGDAVFFGFDLKSGKKLIRGELLRHCSSYFAKNIILKISPHLLSFCFIIYIKKLTLFALVCLS